MVLYSVNFEGLKPPSDRDGWKEIAATLSGIGKTLERAGADCLLLCSSTSHMVADIVQQSIKIPLIDIAEETSKAIAAKKFKTVALLGTKFTMEQAFFKNWLSEFAIKVLIPEEKEREFIHSSIYTEFGRGIFKD